MKTAAHMTGIGVDIVSVARVASVLRRHPSRFPEKVLHRGEYGAYRAQRDPARFLARRFAAKEAVVKALGLGFTGGAYANRIRVAHDARGRPSVVLPPDLPLPPCRREVLLSIADEKAYAVAQAVAFGAPTPGGEGIE